LGIGDWGLGPIPNPQSPIPNPQSPIPNPQFRLFINLFEKMNSLKIKFKIKNIWVFQVVKVVIAKKMRKILKLIHK
jgi:hypothetical protein